MPTNLRNGERNANPTAVGEAMPRPIPVLLIIPVTKPRDVIASTLDPMKNKRASIEKPITRRKKMNNVITLV